MKIASKIIKYFSYISFILLIGIIVEIFIYTVYRSLGVIDLKFIFDSPRGMVLGEDGGIFPAIMGSIWFSFTALIFAFVPAMCASIYSVFYLKNKKVKRFISNVFENIAAIPSIIFGLFSYAVFVYMLGFGRCVLSGGIALALMIFPFLERKIEKSFLEVDKSLLIASYNLGIDTRKTFMKIVLPHCFKEIISSVILAFLFAMSATAPILFTGGVAFATVPNSMMKPAMALPLHLYLMIAQGSSQINRAYGVAAVSLIILFLFSTLAYCLSFKRDKKVKG